MGRPLLFFRSFFLFLFRSTNKMVYEKFVEVGRVAVIAAGANEGKLAAIVDVIDQNRALIEGPGIPRAARSLKDLHLTKIKVKFNHSAKSSIVKKAWEEGEVSKNFEASGWGQRIKKSAIRANLTDFEKFKVNKLKMQRRRLISQAANKAAKKK